MVKLISLAAISLLLFIEPRAEDPDTAILEGRVTDPRNAPISGASVSVRNSLSGKVDVAITDVKGWYILAGLQQGRYSAFTTAEGYGCVWIFNVPLFRGERARLDFTLGDSHQRTSPASCK